MILHRGNKSNMKGEPLERLCSKKRMSWVSMVPAGIENVFKAMFYTVYFNGEFFDTIMDTITR
ncbi:hypothetical protein DPH64_12060 [Salmonella enterica]|nr:hypothetical protein [Salmonella enterica]EBJ1715927.1 hypothetical protein [Salmonella enterica]